MNNLNKRRSLALLLGAMLVAVPASSFAGSSDGFRSICTGQVGRQPRQ